MRLLAALLLAFAPAVQDPVPTLAEGQAHLRRGAFAEAATVFRALVEADDTNATAWGLLGYSLHAAGRLDEALAAHERAATFPATAANACYNAACVHALRGRTDEALAWLEKAVASGFTDRGLLANDAELASVRSDPRFTKLLPPMLEGADAFVERPRVLFTLVGESAGDQFGWVGRNLGDLDADGAADFALTAPTLANGAANASAGRVYVHSGRTGELLFQRDGEAGWRLGNSVAGDFDANGDGTPDVVVGAPGGNGPGHALVLSGKDGTELLALVGSEPGDSFGFKVSGLEDLDGDGCDEVALGAYKADGAGVDAGRVHVVSGKDGRELFRVEGPSAGALFGSAVDGTRRGGHRLLVVGAMKEGGPGRCHVFRCTASGAEPFFTIDPDATAANLGQYFVAVAGDVDADGVPDVYASDWNNAARGPGTGRVYVHSGATGERILTLTGARAGEGFGTSHSICGDVNGDGHADFSVGAWQNADAARSGGKVYLHSGKDGALLGTWTSRQADDTLGFDAVGLGDVDGDGAHDFLLTSAWSAVHGSRTGRAFVVAGAPPGEGE